MMCDQTVESSSQHFKLDCQSDEFSQTEPDLSWIFNSDDTAPSMTRRVAPPAGRPSPVCNCRHKWCLREWSSAKNAEGNSASGRPTLHLRGLLPLRFPEISSTIQSYVKSSVERRRNQFLSWIDRCDASVNAIRRHLLDAVPGLAEAAPKLALSTVRGWLNQLAEYPSPAGSKPDRRPKSLRELLQVVSEQLSQLLAARVLVLPTRRVMNRPVRLPRFRRSSDHPRCRRRLFPRLAAPLTT
ncbi:uncharacterized protein LOC110974716 [Acanthaster planci]|uniref:Uncharacterized protein LOC110974716 n=1 Tax=Acanthaster planci TaxID=133434 RepID=A0A8B7XN07_ACAPL|nr:uncharacterized protein LOC110974716 [Acanthaster planci]